MNIAVIFGGKSSEHEISRMSAATVLKWLNEDENEILRIGIDKSGKWYLTDARIEDIENGRWEMDNTNKPAYIVPDPSVHGILILDQGEISIKKIDVVFPVLHGDHGEDGDIQGLLNMAEIPYVGPGVLASANSMDKSITKKLVSFTGIKQAKYIVIKKYDYDNDRKKEIDRVKDKFNEDYNLFVKPASAGSSVGASAVKSEKELVDAIDLALSFDCKALVEEKITGREIEVAVIGNDEPKASDVGEILSAGEFYDYESKYNNPESKTRVIEDLSRDIIDDIREKAINIYKALDCKGLSRVDFFYTEDGEVIFNEINTLPGFTKISMYPSLWKAKGISGEELVLKLINLALEENSK